MPPMTGEGNEGQRHQQLGKEGGGAQGDAGADADNAGRGAGGEGKADGGGGGGRGEAARQSTEHVADAARHHRPLRGAHVGVAPAAILHPLQRDGGAQKVQQHHGHLDDDERDEGGASEKPGRLRPGRAKRLTLATSVAMWEWLTPVASDSAQPPATPISTAKIFTPRGMKRVMPTVRNRVTREMRNAPLMHHRGSAQQAKGAPQARIRQRDAQHEHGHAADLGWEQRPHQPDAGG